MIKRIIFLGAVIAFGLWIAFAAVPRAFAQDPNRLSLLNISVWPEYDRSTVLVMYDGVLADTSTLLREVSVFIPSKASLQVATYANSDGSLAAEQPTNSTVLGDGYTRVTFTTRTANFHVEYYDDLLRGSPDKTLDFLFKASSPVDSVSAEVQQPLQATNFSLTPATQNTRTDAQGFKYYTLQFPAQSPNQTLTLQVKYTKNNPNPSVLPQAPISSSPAPASPEASQWTSIFLLVAIVVLGLTAVVGFFILQKRSREPLPVRAAPRNRSRRERARASGTQTQAAVFCTQCGHGLGSEDNFCPRCGTKRRLV